MYAAVRGLIRPFACALSHTQCPGAWRAGPKSGAGPSTWIRLRAQQPEEAGQAAEKTPSTGAPTAAGNAKLPEKAKESKEKEEESHRW